MQKAANNNLVLTEFSSLERFADSQTGTSYGGFYQQLTAEFVKDVFKRRVLAGLT
jgi:hypothetical protein